MLPTRPPSFGFDREEDRELAGPCIFAMLQLIEAHRVEGKEYGRLWRDLMSRPSAIRMWHTFTTLGGVTSDDFKAFMDDKPFRNRPVVRRNKHLRLVDAQTTLTVTKRRQHPRYGGASDTSGNDAA